MSGLGSISVSMVQPWYLPGKNMTQLHAQHPARIRSPNSWTWIFPPFCTNAHPANHLWTLHPPRNPIGLLQCPLRHGIPPDRVHNDSSTSLGLLTRTTFNPSIRTLVWWERERCWCTKPKAMDAAVVVLPVPALGWWLQCMVFQRWWV